MIMLTDEQAEQLCDHCHYPYVMDQDELQKVCWKCVLSEGGHDGAEVDT